MEYTAPYQRFDDDRPPYPDEGGAILKVLSIILFIVIAILIGGTAISFAVRGGQLFHAYRPADPTPQKVINVSRRTNDRVDAYTDLGQMRIRTKAVAAGEAGTVVVLSPWFTYPEGDSALFEEIAQKERLAKSIFSEYFSSYTKNELLGKGELQVKGELLALINSQLVLGKIRAVYFNQYLFLE